FWGIVIQAYLKDSLSDVKKLVQFAKTRSVPFTVRLVKGAYWDYETVVFKQRNWEVPVYVNKSETDFNYENCLYELLKNHSYIKTAVASHNVRSISVAMVLARQFGIPQNGLKSKCFLEWPTLLKKP
ncbi:MAG: proline dehydrogenase family protein, partial [Bdellovibrionales bacterium]|nr:proline dehydrogenase family protein [Bdellovibrionales bacterium]